MRNIRQNLFFAFIYNALGVPVAAGVLYPFFGILLSPSSPQPPWRCLPSASWPTRSAFGECACRRDACGSARSAFFLQLSLLQANPTPTTAKPRVYTVSFAQLVVMTSASRFEDGDEVRRLTRSRTTNAENIAATLKRRYVLAFFQKLPPCLVGIEACASVHHWSRESKHLVIPSADAAGLC